MSEKYWTTDDLKAFGYSADEPEVHSITNAESRHSESVDYRFKSYAFKMFLRIVCIVGALYTDGWVMWLCIAGAGLLPWIAVVLANGHDRQHSHGDFSAYLTQEQLLQLAAAEKVQQGKAESASAGAGGSSADWQGEDWIEGEVVEDGGK